MLIRWAHRYLPAVAGYLSYVVNPVLAYFILTEPKNSSIGKYRFLILFFAVFDMVYSTVELFVPVVSVSNVWYLLCHSASGYARDWIRFRDLSGAWTVFRKRGTHVFQLH